MKIINGLQLLQEPKGTVFQSYEPIIFGPLMRLEQVHPDYGDFEYVLLTEPDYDEVDETLRTPGVSSRWGLYNLNTAHFLVWEASDVQHLIQLLQGVTLDSLPTCSPFPKDTP